MMMNKDIAQKGLYIHIPFCVKKCEYCDFVSFPNCDMHFDAYLDKLCAEMKLHCGERVDTIFIGGGTPSVLSAGQLERLCGDIKASFKISDDVEWTIEVNPGTVSDEKIKALHQCGINRISVGVQSFNDTELKAAGRIHTAKDAYDTVLKLHEGGFSNISIDLMAMLPSQTPQSFKSSLQTAMELPITHISVYSLIIEDGTPIKEKYDSGIYQMPDEDTDRELYAFTDKYLCENGFLRYEISNYAKGGAVSRHNLKYWDCDEYIGIGLAAHSYTCGVRSYNTSDLSEYLKGITTVGEDVLSKTDMMSEFMMLGLRKIRGISRDEFYNRFIVSPEDIWGDALERFISIGVMERNDDFYALTPRGLDVANSVMCEFM